MKIPSKLKIGGHIYQIRLVETKKIDGEDDDIMGFCDKGKCEIRLANNLADSQLEETLLHEIIHAINNVMNHELIESLAHSLHQVLKDNRLLK